MPARLSGKALGGLLRWHLSRCLRGLRGNCYGVTRRCSWALDRRLARVLRWRHGACHSTFHVLTFLGGDVEIARLAHLEEARMEYRSVGATRYVREGEDLLVASA